MLLSRKKYASSEVFRDEFLKTLTPGVIDRKDFIHWGLIDTKLNYFERNFSFLTNLIDCQKDNFIQRLADSLLSSDKPEVLIKLCFELLGHTDNKRFVSKKDFLKFSELPHIDPATSNDIANLLYEIGLPNIVSKELRDYFVGVQVGLESHRRKGIGGEAFRFIVQGELDRVVTSLRKKGINLTLKPEDKILYSDGITSKSVDFSLKFKDKKIGIEVNFYTVSGSKPTEIKRSYAQVAQQLIGVNCLLIWVTDGIGYMDMKRSLKEAFDIHKNIYNLKMFISDFEQDLECFLKGQSYVRESQ